MTPEAQPQDDWEPVGGSQPQDDWQPVASAPAASLPDIGLGQPDISLLPKAFLDRVKRGEALTRALKAAKEGFGEGFGDEPVGMSAEHVQQLQEAGIYHDPATGRGGAIRLMNEAMIQPAALLGDLALRSVSGGVHALGHTLGQIAEDMGVEAPKRLERETINFLNYLMLRGDHQFGRPDHSPAGPRDQSIGRLPTDADFKRGAEILGGKDAEENLRGLWHDDGIHPAEAVHDAQNDAFKMELLTLPFEHSVDRSGLAPVQNSPVPAGTPRSELARTGDPYVDRVLFSQITKRNIDNPIINDRYDVPYAAGGSTPLKDPEMFVDRHFPRSMEVDGVRYDPVDPFTIHENVEQHVMEQLINGGMEPNTAYMVAHWEFAEKAENAWYKAHGIDPAHAAEAYQPFFEPIQHETPINPPPNLYKDAYPSDNVRAAANEPIPEAKPTATDIKQAKAILDAQELPGELGGEPLRAVGAQVTTPPPSLAQQPPPAPGRLSTAFHDAASKLFDIGRDIQMKIAPMATGTRDSMALAKDFANSLRRNRWEWSRYDTDLEKRFTPEQRKRMWNAADEESVAIQLGESREHQGVVTLTPEERAAVEDLHARAQTAWLRARDLGMVEGEGLPAYTPRMVINAANALGDKPIALNSIGRNLRVTTPQLRRRQYMMAEETEAAAKAKLGPEAEIARDIRVLPLATARLEDAIAGRTLVNAIKDYGKRTGDDAVAEGFKPGKDWFTIDHPALKTWKPKFETDAEGKVVPVTDKNDNIIFQQVPIYIRGDFEGPLRSVLTQQSGALYGAAMSLKGKTMSMIMNSPIIHNAVEWGRALPAMPGKVATFKVYFEGNRAKNNPEIMREAIDSGLVPIGKRFFNQDITAIMEAPDLTPGRSWTAKVLGFVPGLFDAGAETAVRRAIDKAGDFWHNTMLWDRVADLQMGLYTNFRDELVGRGVDQQTASRAAAHWANRYAGALPQEAMSDNARKIANMLLFSRSFTLGNLGVMKDMLTGLPKDVIAQMERDAGFRAGAINEAGELVGPAAEAVQFAKSMAKRRAMAIVALDMGLMYVGNSLLQNVMNVLASDSTLDKEMHGYAERFSNAMADVKEHPLKLLQPFQFLQDLSATSENEPNRQERVKVGYTADGTAIYARNPAGKIGEEFVGYLTGPLDMLRRKLGTVARPAWQIMSNDAGFGRKVYDSNADTPEKYLKNLGLIAAHVFKSQFPVGQLSAASDLVKGEGDPKLSALQAFGPVAGVTFSKGAPGGPAVGELYAARAQHQYAVDAALPDIRRQIQKGDIDGAIDSMTELGIPQGLQQFYIRTGTNPASRLNSRTLRDFYLYATPEQRQRLERSQRQGAPPPQ